MTDCFYFLVYAKNAAVATLGLYDILMAFGIPLKLVRLVKMCLYETFSRFQVDKHLSDTFPINPLNNELNPICQ